jgi:hypothetical protein
MHGQMHEPHLCKAEWLQAVAASPCQCHLELGAWTKTEAGQSADLFRRLAHRIVTVRALKLDENHHPSTMQLWRSMQLAVQSLWCKLHPSMSAQSWPSNTVSPSVTLLMPRERVEGLLGSC